VSSFQKRKCLAPARHGSCLVSIAQSLETGNRQLETDYA
jgi:hypothetical protein